MGNLAEQLPSDDNGVTFSCLLDGEVCDPVVCALCDRAICADPDCWVGDNEPDSCVGPGMAVIVHSLCHDVDCIDPRVCKYPLETRIF